MNAGQVAFLTDDEIARRLAQVENRLRDFEAAAAIAAREVAALRAELTRS